VGVFNFPVLRLSVKSEGVVESESGDDDKDARQVNEEVNREKTGGADEIKFGKQMTTGFHNLPFAMLTRRK